MPRAVENIDLTGFDVVLSSSHAVGKGIVPPSTAVHVCYCHTPMRYAWEMEQEYLRDFRVPRFLWKTLRKTLSDLRRWDLATSKRIDQFISNSNETAKRVRDTYGRDSVVIPPPVSDHFFEHEVLAHHKRSGFLSVGRLVPYKRIDLLIHAANALGAPLTIAGTGQEEARLKAIAGPTVRFLGYVPDTDLPGLYASAQAVLFAAHEDAGIVPLEAQACGTPVIAYGRGGALESIMDGKTGLLFSEQSVESLTKAIKDFSAITFDHEAIRKHTRQYSESHFRELIESVVSECLEKFGRARRV